MFELMLFLAAGIALVGALIAFDGSRDAFHPLVFIGPMLAFLYGWMPFKLLQEDGLARYFDGGQLRFVQLLNVLGVLAFVGACLSVGVRFKKTSAAVDPLTPRAARRMLAGSALVGSVGLSCWLITIINVGGFVQAFSTSYSGGWDASGYVRDGSLLLLMGVLFALTALASGASRLIASIEMLVFGLPWLSSALLMGRRGPTFAFAVILLMGWYFNRTKRPPLLLMGVGGACLGWLVLFLVTNRNNIYIGSDFHLKSDVTQIVDTPDTGNEFIYGAGTVLSAQRHDHYYWMRRYLAQVLVRPIPSAIWPTKYEDFGVPELLYNAGTGEGFGDALGWVGAPGSAPGIVADLWVEVWWFAVLAMGVLGRTYGIVWKKAVLKGGGWSTQYIILSCLSLYLVMQTMEAVIFRTLLLSIPSWLVWRWALAEATSRVRPRLIGGRLQGPTPRRRLIAEIESPASAAEVSHV